MNLDFLVNLPWQQIFPMLGTISLILFTFGPKLKFVRKFFGNAIQDFVGVTALRDDLMAMHNENKASAEAALSELHVLSEKVENHGKRLDEHETLLKKLV